jgi:SAM-dependent MidA family methyltransferase
MQLDLPTPSELALEHSARLCRTIAAQIEATAADGGWISFAAYMQQVLYAPGLGYYSAGSSKFGEAGDFVTAPEISSMFSRCLAGQIAEVLQSLAGGSVLELGAGTGVMAADMLLELEQLGWLPERYMILEPSADLRQRQAATIANKAAHLQHLVSWLDAAPAEPFSGVVVGNEVVDAIPVERFRIVAGAVQALGVTGNAAEFAYSPCAAGEALRAAVTEALPDKIADYPDGYESELCLLLPAWIASISDWLDNGTVLLLDYGYPGHEYYLPARTTGTLRCYYRHRAHDNPFLWPGLQDLTAWVDFSYLARAAIAAGFAVTGFTTQANFLLAAGIDERVAAQATDLQAQIEMAAGLRQLLLPGEMGEAVKVLALSKGDAAVPSAMQGRDLRNRL